MSRAPAQRLERLERLDALRALALLPALVVNMRGFNAADLGGLLSLARQGSMAAWVLVWLVTALPARWVAKA